MKFVTPALKHIVFPALSKSGYLRYSVGAGPAIVTYHGVFPSGYEVRNQALDGNLVRPDSLRQQLRLLKKRYHVITPEEFLGWSDEKLTLAPRSILLTCDDTLRNNVTEMLPILQELGLSCLFFATGASADPTPSMLWYEEFYLMLLDASEPITFTIPDAGVRVGPIVPSERHASWWNSVEQLSQFDRSIRRRFLDEIREQLKLPANWKERYLQNPTLAARFLTLDTTGLRQLVAAGMTIGAHSVSHPILARASEQFALLEISESRGVLEKALGKPVWAFGYPFGNAATVTVRDLQLVERAGFRCAFMNTGGGFGAKFNRFAIPRVHVTAEMTVFEFEAHISGFYRTLREKLTGGAEQEALGSL